MLDQARPFLDVARSVTGRVWVDRLDEAGRRTARAIEQRLSLSDILSRILAGRGVTADTAAAFLNPTIRELMPNPSLLLDMDRVAERLAQAVIDRETVALFGDYDVDGACSCALVTRYFRYFGIEPIVYIPDRIFEGYGPNIPAVDKLVELGATLLVTLDCGTVSDAPIAHARSSGLDVLVIDHHLSDFELPIANGIVNPNRPDDISELGYLCAAGVSFMVLVAVNRVLREKGIADLPNLMSLTDIVGLATVCDVVPLTGLNRAFVVRGLEMARRGSNPGIAALALAARIGGPMNPYHFGFLIGPRINAGGRIGEAGLGARLLSLDEQHQVMAIAATLHELNGERQRLEVDAVAEATAAAEAEIGHSEGPPILVLASANWHPGVVGLVAARLREKFERPAFAIALQPDGTGTGSGRSLPGVDLGRAVIDAVELGIIAKGGGHSMAAGVTVKPGQLGPFRAHLTALLSEEVATARMSTALRIDAAVTARGATPELAHEIARAGPFGAGNPAPTLAFPAHRAKFAEIVGQGGHVRFTLASDDGARLKAIAFRAAASPLGDLLLRSGGGALNIAGTLDLDNWQGREQVQLRVSDASPAGGS